MDAFKDAIKEMVKIREEFSDYRKTLTINFADFNVPGWTVRKVLDSDGVTLLSAFAKKGSMMSFRRSSNTHIFLKNGGNPFSLKIFECNRQCCDTQEACSPLVGKEIRFGDIASKKEGVIYREDFVYMSPSFCYCIVPEEDSEFAICVFSTSLKV